MARSWEARVAEYVDSPWMRRRLKTGTEVCCTIDGTQGTYIVRANMARESDESCTCPVGEEGMGGCKHTEALRRTHRLRPRSFVDLDAVLDSVGKKEKADLLKLMRSMILRSPASLGALGVAGFEDLEEASE